MASPPPRRVPAPQQPPQTPEAAAAQAELVALYAGLNATLLAGITVILAKLVATPAGRAKALRDMRQFARTLAMTVPPQREALIGRLMAAEEAGGRQAALRQIEALSAARSRQEASPRGGRRPAPAPALSRPAAPSAAVAARVPGDSRVSAGRTAGDLSLPHGVRAAALIRAELSKELQAAERAIASAPEDVFREVVSDAAVQKSLANGITPLEAEAHAWREFIQRGVTGFQDRSGRRWNLATYTEMAVRTAGTRAFNASTVEQLLLEGIELFTVPAHNDPCPLCFPWQHAVLSMVANPWADATVAEAEAAGLFHPNCRHTLVGWMPGLSERLAMEKWGPNEQARYDATQRQRALERSIRRAKLQQQYAISENQRRQAAGEVRELQARLRRHVANHGNLSRDPIREQPDLGFGR